MLVVGGDVNVGADLLGVLEGKAGRLRQRMCVRLDDEGLQEKRQKGGEQGRAASAPGALTVGGVASAEPSHAGRCYCITPGVAKPGVSDFDQQRRIAAQRHVGGAARDMAQIVEQHALDGGRREARRVRA